MVIEARPRLAEVLRKLSVAGRQHEDLVCFLDRALDVVAALVRPDIRCAVVLLLQHIAELAPIARAYADIGVALVVLEKYIVFRGMLLYQAALENKRLKLAVGDDVLEPVDVVDHAANLFGVVVLRTEVLTDAVFERLCLADIDDLAVLRVHDVHARQQRQRHSLFSQLGKFGIHGISFRILKIKRAKILRP